MIGGAIVFGAIFLALVTYLVCSFIMFCREDNRRQSPVYQITDARARLRRIFRDAERQMDEAAGHKDHFNFGSRSDW